MQKSKTDLLDKLDTNNLSKIQGKSKSKSKSTIKSNKKNTEKRDLKKTGKISVKKYCDNYKYNNLCKYDNLCKQNKTLYDACQINQYCRKNKCKDIDRKFNNVKNNKLGINGNMSLMTSIISTCPIEISNISSPKCVNKATKRFYEENNMGDIYKQVLHCDKKTCAKERKQFFTNLFQTNKTKKRIKQSHQVNLEDIPDQQMIESN